MDEQNPASNLLRIIRISIWSIHEEGVESSSCPTGGVINHVVIPSPASLSEVRALVTAAARCWRTARDQHAKVQRRLYTFLIGQDCGMLAPVFNGLLTLYEVALGRPIVVGRAELSSDEHELLRIVDGSDDHPITMSCSEGMAAAFYCAVRSARIMLAKVLAERIGPHRPAALVPIPFSLKEEERLFT